MALFAIFHPHSQYDGTIIILAKVPGDKFCHCPSKSNPDQDATFSIFRN